MQSCHLSFSYHDQAVFISSWFYPGHYFFCSWVTLNQPDLLGFLGRLSQGSSSGGCHLSPLRPDQGCWLPVVLRQQHHSLPAQRAEWAVAAAQWPAEVAVRWVVGCGFVCSCFCCQSRLCPEACSHLRKAACKHELWWISSPDSGSLFLFSDGCPAALGGVQPCFHVEAVWDPWCLLHFTPAHFLVPASGSACWLGPPREPGCGLSQLWCLPREIIGRKQTLNLKR